MSGAGQERRFRLAYLLLFAPAAQILAQLADKLDFSEVLEAVVLHWREVTRSVWSLAFNWIDLHVPLPMFVGPGEYDGLTLSCLCLGALLPALIRSERRDLFQDIARASAWAKWALSATGLALIILYWLSFADLERAAFQAYLVPMMVEAPELLMLSQQGAFLVIATAVLASVYCGLAAASRSASQPFESTIFWVALITPFFAFGVSTLFTLSIIGHNPFVVAAANYLVVLAIVALFAFCLRANLVGLLSILIFAAAIFATDALARWAAPVVAFLRSAAQ